MNETKNKYVDIGKRKWWALGAIALASVAFSLDLTVLNLALPQLSIALHASTNQLQWIVDAYALVLAALTLPAGLLGDRYGRKKFMLIALVLFGIGSAICAYSTSTNMLISARVILGIGAAFILPLALSVIPVFFSDDEKPKATALLMGGVFVAYPLGPIIGGYLLTHYWWGSVFLINVPIVLLALILVALLLPESKSAERHSIDYGGIVLSIVGLTGITYGAIEAGSKGWGNSQIVASLFGGAIVLALFVLWETRKMRSNQSPLVDLDLFKSARFSWGTLLATAVTFCMFGLLFVGPQYLQEVQGNTALRAGYLLLPMAVGLVLGSVVGNRLMKMIGAKFAIALGFALMAAGMIIGSRTGLDASNLFIITWIGITGIGLGFAIPGAMDAALGDLSPERSGVGSSLVTAIRQVGGTLGVAVLGTILSTSYTDKLNLPKKLAGPVAAAINGSVTGGVTIANKIHSALLLQVVKTAYIHGMEVILLVCAGLALVSVAVALAFLPNRSAATSDDEVTRPKTGLQLGEQTGVRVAIQVQALRLFAEQGYIETTVEQVSDAAGIPMSTFYQYFANKEAVVLHDDTDTLIIQAFQSQPAELNTGHALRHALNMVFSELPEGQLAREQKKTEFMHDVPQLHGERLGEVARNINLFTGLIAQRMGLPANDASVHVLADSISGDMEYLFTKGA